MTPDGGKSDATGAPEGTPPSTGAGDSSGASDPNQPQLKLQQPDPEAQKQAELAARQQAQQQAQQQSVSEPMAFDPFVESLVHLSHHFGRPQSAIALTAGIPLVDGYVPFNQLERAGARADIIVEHAKLPLRKVRPLHLPAILVLKKGGACVLKSIERDEAGKPRYVEVFIPGEKDQVQTRQYKELKKAYTGKIIYTKPTYDTGAKKLEEYQGKPDANWFWSAFKPSSWIYGQVISATVIINLFALAMPLFIMNVYDRVVPNNAVDTLWALAIGVGIAAIFDFILRGARGYFVDVAGRRADVVLANRIFDRVLGAKMEHRARSSGAQANTLREYETLRDFFNSATLATFGDMPFIFLFVFVIWVVAGPLALVPLITVPIVIGVSLLTQIPLNRIVRQSFQDAAQKNAVLFETLNGLETIKSTGAEGWAADKWERSVAEHIRTGVKSRLISSISVNLMMASQMISTVALVVIGVGLISEGEITPGALIAAVILNGRALAPLGQVAQVLTKMYAARTAFGAVKRLMETPQERPDDSRFTYKSDYDGAIEFKKVSFTYPDEKVPALTDISLSISPGERVGLIGPIGSGKSTIMKLILRIYDPSEGAVLHDGIDGGQLDPAILRSNLGYMPQDAQLFQGTIRSNVTIHAPQVTEQQILKAASEAGALPWLNRLPAGLDTRVGERGDGLSGGQQQSIALIRSLIKSPPILLLDEPTSEMDGKNEQNFMAQIRPVLSGRTVVLVTHRPVMLNLVDRLIVLDQGKVVADGPRDAILAKLKPVAQPKAGEKQTSGARTATSARQTQAAKPAPDAKPAAGVVTTAASEKTAAGSRTPDKPVSGAAGAETPPQARTTKGNISAHVAPNQRAKSAQNDAAEPADGPAQGAGSGTEDKQS